VLLVACNFVACSGDVKDVGDISDMIESDEMELPPYAPSADGQCQWNGKAEACLAVGQEVVCGTTFADSDCRGDPKWTGLHCGAFSDARHQCVRCDFDPGSDCLVLQAAVAASSGNHTGYTRGLPPACGEIEMEHGAYNHWKDILGDAIWGCPKKVNCECPMGAECVENVQGLWDGGTFPYASSGCTSEVICAPQTYNIPNVEICEANSQCVDGVGCCLPNCEGKECGADGCGGSCSKRIVFHDCGESDYGLRNFECIDGKCVCTPECPPTSGGCGDGCGGTCQDAPLCLGLSDCVTEPSCSRNGTTCGCQTIPCPDGCPQGQTCILGECGWVGGGGGCPGGCPSDQICLADACVPFGGGGGECTDAGPCISFGQAGPYCLPNTTSIINNCGQQVRCSLRDANGASVGCQYPIVGVNDCLGRAGVTYYCNYGPWDPCAGAIGCGL
jgi:hypothetical protein